MKVGILGGGQLARMLTHAGGPLGVDFVIVDPNSDACAADAGEFVHADYDSPDVTKRLADCDRITCDFENVPAATLERLARAVPVRPAAAALAVAQDRLTEKQRFGSLGIDTAAFEAVDSRTDLIAAVERIGMPAVLKTRRMGYDGKGQHVLRDGEDLELAWQRLGERPLILEQWVDFDYECAITAVRSATGELRYWPVSRTWHRYGILSMAVSAPVPESLQHAAEALVRALAEELDYVGSLTLELFVVGDKLLANEFAPRVHNSAHWTIEGAVCSQFENHLRAVCDWPLGETSRVGVSAMINFIGAMPPRNDWLARPGAHWHDYRKADRPGRKVGHVTLWAPDAETLRARLSGLEAGINADQLREVGESLAALA